MSRGSLTPPPHVVAVLGWLVPGLGYWLLRQRARGVTVGVTITILFLIGVLVGGIRVVEPPELRGNLVGNLLQNPWYIGQIFTGSVGIIASFASTQAGQVPDWADTAARARLGDIARLYTAVAGMLNLLVVIDAFYRASRGGKTA